jgi:hypothetical protein
VAEKVYILDAHLAPLASQLKALQITLDHALLPALLPEVTTK